MLTIKNNLILLFLITSSSLFSQTDKIVGEYFRDLGDSKHKIEYTLTLNPDYTFTFYYYSKMDMVIQETKHQYGKGTWRVDGKVVSFFTNSENDFDEKYTLDFNKSQARFIIKSPRDKSDRVVKTRLQFFESGIFWIKGLDIFKTTQL